MQVNSNEVNNTCAYNETTFLSKYLYLFPWSSSLFRNLNSSAVTQCLTVRSRIDSLINCFNFGRDANLIHVLFVIKLRVYTCLIPVPNLPLGLRPLPFTRIASLLFPGSACDHTPSPYLTLITILNAYIHLNGPRNSKLLLLEKIHAKWMIDWILNMMENSLSSLRFS